MTGGGSTLHYGNPWADPPEARNPLRRLRGRLVLPITVWTAYGDGQETVGLTVSSVLVAQGEPGMIAGLLSPTSDLAGLLEKPGATFVVHVLGAAHRRLAQHFAGELPAPSEMLATTASPHGPLLQIVRDRALCRSEGGKLFGWSLLVEAVIDAVQVHEPAKGLAWYRGEYRAVGDGA